MKEGDQIVDPLTEERMDLLRGNYKECGSKAPRSFEKETKKDQKNQTFVDVHHSHLCLVGDESSSFGSEIQLRNEIERYACEKFGIPVLQFVFGGGPNTVATALGFQKSPKALSCIVKGSGRFCHAIERCHKLENQLESSQERVGWLLQKSMSQHMSNHDFGQIKSITDNSEKYRSPISSRAGPTFGAPLICPILFFSTASRFFIFDHLAMDAASIFKKYIKQQVCALCIFVDYFGIYGVRFSLHDEPCMCACT